jgi:hypothetical protein
VDIGLLVLLVVGFSWLAREIARVQRGQRIVEKELERIASALDLPARTQPMIRCPKCASLYVPDLTGCPRCGRAKSPDATLVQVSAAAIDPVSLTARASEPPSIRPLST